MNLEHLGLTVPEAYLPRFEGHEPHQHDVPHLVYIVSGVGRLTLDDATVVLHERQAAWLAAGVRHGLKLSADGIALGPMLAPDCAPPGGAIRVLGPVQTLTRLMTVLMCAPPTSDEERAPLSAALGSVLRSTMREHFNLTLPGHPVAQAVALDCARHQGTLAELAERHFTSVRHVQRLFIEETGLSFARWRTRARLNLAIMSLRAGEGMRTAMHASGFATRHGLLKAVSRECGIPLEALLADPGAAMSLLDTAA